jgi:hypothetical protein
MSSKIWCKPCGSVGCWQCRGFVADRVIAMAVSMLRLSHGSLGDHSDAPPPHSKQQGFYHSSAVAPAFHNIHQVSYCPRIHSLPSFLPPVHHIQLTNPFALREHAVNHLVEKIYFSLRLCEEVGVRNIILYLKVIEAIYYL